MTDKDKRVVHIQKIMALYSVLHNIPYGGLA